MEVEREVDELVDREVELVEVERLVEELVLEVLRDVEELVEEVERLEEVEEVLVL